MKVLMLGWELPPHNSGGLGVACLQMCRALAKNGADITFVVPYESEHNFDFMNVVSAKIASTSDITGVYDSASFTEFESTNGGNVHEIQRKYELAIENIVQSTSFRIIHAHDWLTFRAAIKAKHLSGKPLILHVHSIESDRAGGNVGNPIVRDIEQLGFLMADRIVAVSQHTKNKIIDEYFIPADKIIVAHNSIDQLDMAPLDPDNCYRGIEILKSSGYKVIATVSRLTVQKGLTNLLYAARSVVDKEPKTIFLIVGSGDQYFELLELSASLGISQNVIFTGFLRGKKWRDAFAIADLFVMPSVSEPFGLTPLEAAVYGTPSIVSKQSGVAEVFKNSLKVDFWDSSKMADQIVAAVRYESLTNLLTENAYSELQHFSWDRTSKILMETYSDHATKAEVQYR